MPTASFMPWAAPSQTRDTVLEGTGESLMFKGFVVTSLSTGKEKEMQNSGMMREKHRVLKVDLLSRRSRRWNRRRPREKYP